MSTPPNQIVDKLRPGTQTSDYQSGTRQRAISFADVNLPPPSPLYVSGDELLVFQCFNSVAGATLLVQMRILLPDGSLSRMEQRFQLTSARANNVFEIPLQECFLLSVTFAASTVGVRTGQFYVTANIEFGAVGKGSFQYQLFAGYLSQAIVAGWPTSSPKSCLDGPGMMLSIQNAAPGAGADFTVTVPTQARWKVRAINAQLVTAVAVATRAVELEVSDGAGNLLLIAPANVTQAASLSIRYQGSAAPYPATTIATRAFCAFPPDLVLFQGWKILSSTGSIQAADQWSVQNLIVEEWIEP